MFVTITSMLLYHNFGVSDSLWDSSCSDPGYTWVRTSKSGWVVETKTEYRYQGYLYDLDKHKLY